MRVIVIGAGVGGLTVASVLAKAGLAVTVLEATHNLGGCASTFEVNGFRFDAGATLAGGFAPNGPMSRLADWLGLSWKAHPVEPAMVVHLPNAAPIVRWGNAQKWVQERRQKFGVRAETFWQWQERTAQAMWSLASALPPWLPKGYQEWSELAKRLWAFVWEQPSRVFLLPDAFRSVCTHLPPDNPVLRLFVDAQLLISAQCLSHQANALYGAAALDLPRQGVVHFEGGIGTLAATLAEAVSRSGGAVLLGQVVKRIVMEREQPLFVETENGDFWQADLVVANVTPSSIAQLLGEHAPRWLKRLPPYPEDGWGAFMLYLGVDASALPADLPLHHQIVVAEPLGEGNSVFLSFSSLSDATRAPAGYCALTISTHTRLSPWWQAKQEGRDSYERLKSIYTERVLRAVERVLPSLREAIVFQQAATPVTFEHFTRRPFGWVGGFPQTSLFRTVPPRILPRVWLVGDSIFPGQSTTAVALSGMRVALAILRELALGTSKEGEQPTPSIVKGA